MHAAVELLPFISGILWALLNPAPSRHAPCASLFIGFLCAFCAGELAGLPPFAFGATTLDTFFAAIAILATRALGKILTA